MRSLTIDVVTDDRALDALAGDWDALARVTPRWSAFQSFAWVTACRAALPGSGRFFVIYALRDLGPTTGGVRERLSARPRATA